MTLILTELTSFGIAMAADSAVKVINTRTGLAQIVPGVARKLQQVPYLMLEFLAGEKVKLKIPRPINGYPHSLRPIRGLIICMTSQASWLVS